MPGDEADEIDAPPLPRYSGSSKVAATFHPDEQLCPDHKPVIDNLRHLDDIHHTAVNNAQAEYIRQCCQTRRNP